MLFETLWEILLLIVVTLVVLLVLFSLFTCAIISVLWDIFTSKKNNKALFTEWCATLALGVAYPYLLIRDVIKNKKAKQ